MVDSIVELLSVDINVGTVDSIVEISSVDRTVGMVESIVEVWSVDITAYKNISKHFNIEIISSTITVSDCCSNKYQILLKKQT